MFPNATQLLIQVNLPCQQAILDSKGFLLQADQIQTNSMVQCAIKATSLTWCTLQQRCYCHCLGSRLLMADRIEICSDWAPCIHWQLLSVGGRPCLHVCYDDGFWFSKVKTEKELEEGPTSVYSTAAFSTPQRQVKPQLLPFDWVTGVTCTIYIPR